MGRWKLYTPEGFQDILFEECYLKRKLEENIRNLFITLGYNEIETPGVEFYDAFCGDGELLRQESMFKFFDQRGRILVLKPDMTVPVARVTATKMKDAVLPIRYFYIGNTYKYDELGGGKQKEFTQAGLELMGVSNAAADAEIIVAAIHSVRSAGLENFQIDVGQVEFFKGLMEETELLEEDIEQIRRLIDRKDYFGIEELVSEKIIREDLRELILSLPRLFGSVDVIDKICKMCLNERSRKALENLREVLEIIDDYGLSKFVSVDLGMLPGLDYYTGIIFKGFTHGAGFPILTGGRYDSLVGKFGKPCAATGFSLGINMLMLALERQKIDGEKAGIDTLVCYDGNGRKTALNLADELRRQGLRVVTDVTLKDIEWLKEYAAAKGIGGMLRITSEQSIEVYNLDTGDMTMTSFDELLGIK